MNSTWLGWGVMAASLAGASLLVADVWVPATGSEPDPSWPTVAGEIIRRVDRDGDRRVGASEYRRVDPEGTMVQWDLDQSGDLSAFEVERCFASANPMRYLEQHARPGDAGEWGF